VPSSLAWRTARMALRCLANVRGVRASAFLRHAPGHSRVTDSRHQEDPRGHGRTRRSRDLSSDGPLRSQQVTPGHSTNTVGAYR